MKPASNPLRARRATWYFLALALPAVLCAKLLQHGLLVGDFGDNQLAAMTLGIAHPPGYAMLSLIEHPFTLLSRTDPAFCVTVLNWAIGVASMFMTFRLLHKQLRVHPALATAAAFGFCCWPIFWKLWVNPEVYVTFLFGVTLLCTAFIRWELTGRPAALVAATFFLSMLVSTRVNSSDYLPFYALALATALFRSRAIRRRLGRRFIIACICAAVIPAVTVFSYVWLRDTPGRAYDYVHQYELATGRVPPLDAGIAAKWTRLWWLVTATEYKPRIISSPLPLLGKLGDFLGTQSPPRLAALIALLALSAVGCIALRRRLFGSLVLLIGIVIGEATFLIAFRVIDRTDMCLSIGWVLVLLSTVGLDRLIRGRIIATASRLRRTMAPLAVASLAICVSSVVLFKQYYQEVEHPSHVDFPPLNWSKLPPHACIATMWVLYPLLAKARIDSGRGDIDVMCPAIFEPRLRTLARARPFYFYHFPPRMKLFPGWNASRENDMWLMHPPADLTVGHTS